MPEPTEYEWGNAKAEANIKKHRISFERVFELDWGRAYIVEDDRRDYGEKRLIGFAPIGDRLYVLVYSLRGSRRRVISLRKANEREYARYKHVQETQNADAGGGSGD